MIPARLTSHYDADEQLALTAGFVNAASFHPADHQTFNLVLHSVAEYIPVAR